MAAPYIPRPKPPPKMVSMDRSVCNVTLRDLFEAEFASIAVDGSRLTLRGFDPKLCVWRGSPIRL